MILNFRFRLKLCLTSRVKIHLKVLNVKCVNCDETGGSTPVLCINIDKRYSHAALMIKG